eukprot:CAMPEP_0172520582 /NCGR_PEP_ID=MMETSP1066-20121228/292080_1 /TAXON_ID=671091 /ORGANISM="Coscinodiscus wailesii, Strain CCMP2513" /LENGTH=79 /DNA_ID=CAMNT_0013303371 /DNA_START=1170 /DNA_END=1406 /DNA_ORIENTATION=+
MRAKKGMCNWFVEMLLFLAMYSSIILVWVRQSAVYYMFKSYTFKNNDPSNLTISYHNGIYDWDAREQSDGRVLSIVSTK